MFKNVSNEQCMREVVKTFSQFKIDSDFAASLLAELDQLREIKRLAEEVTIKTACGANVNLDDADWQLLMQEFGLLPKSK